MLLMIFVFAVGIVLFHIGLAKSAIYLLMKRKKFCSRGTNTFILRNLSGTLGASSVMLGVLAFLMTFAVIGSNVSFVQRSGERASLDRNYPYDVTYYENVDETDQPVNRIPLPEAEKIIETYQRIERKISYTVYTSGRQGLHRYTKWSGEGYQGMTDNFISESDFNAITTPLGYDPIHLDHEFVIVANIPEAAQMDWSGVKLNFNGVTCRFRETLLRYPMFSYTYFYAIVPDEMTDGMMPQAQYMVYDLEDGKYDANGLLDALTYTITEEYEGEIFTDDRSNFRIREFSRQYRNNSAAILVVGALFVAAVFLFLSMAILALKTLSGIADDQKRYLILFHLGAGERERCRALFGQTFSFFVIPFAAALLMSFPTAEICSHIMEMNQMTNRGEAYLIAAGIVVVMLFIYLLYYAATYLIAKRALI